MAALLVSLAVMAVLMSVALPVWRHDAQREKEEELVWRGQQYVRAIRLYQTKNQVLPPSIDVLVQGRYIRKKFMDPITGEDFVPIPAAGSIPGQGGQTVGGGRAGQGGTVPAGSGVGAPAGGFTSSGSSFPSAFGSTSGGMVPGGMMGVMSKSKEESIRVYQGRNHYNEWQFLFVSVAPGGGRGQPGGPGGVGGPGGGRGRGGRGDTLSPGGGGRGTFPGGAGRGTFPGGGRSTFPGGGRSTFPGGGRSMFSGGGGL
jgi:type II secretory pathway pseudopilin PulG